MSCVHETFRVGKKYSVIYADLPWEDHTWTQEKIREMPVQKWAASEALLLLWIPMSQLPPGLILLGQWGFAYAGILVWRKLKDDLEDPSLYGEGEFMLLGKMGDVKPSGLLRQNVYEAGAGRGPYKPRGFRRIFEYAGYQAFGDSASYLDIFGRYWQGKDAEYKQGHWDFLME